MQRSAERSQPLVHALQPETAIPDAALDLKAHAIVPDYTAQAVLVLIDLNANETRSRMPRGVRQGLLDHAIQGRFHGSR